MRLTKCSPLLVTVLSFPILSLRDRTDIHTFIPTIERFYSMYGKYPERITADSDMDALKIISTVKNITLRLMLNTPLGKENAALESRLFTN